MGARRCLFRAEANMKRRCKVIEFPTAPVVRCEYRLEKAKVLLFKMNEDRQRYVQRPRRSSVAASTLEKRHPPKSS
jgi:hypothetical protein